MIRALLSDDFPLSINIDGRDVIVMSHAVLLKRLAEAAMSLEADQVAARPQDQQQ